MPPPLSLDNQYAFCPTGSTKAALVSLLDNITKLLGSNQYVVVISVDFAKAFDSIRLLGMVETLSILEMPDNILNCFVNNLECRNHVASFEGKTSSVKTINTNVVQCFVVDPAEFIICTSDLHPVHSQNRLLI